VSSPRHWVTMALSARSSRFSSSTFRWMSATCFSVMRFTSPHANTDAFVVANGLDVHLGQTAHRWSLNGSSKWSSYPTLPAGPTRHGDGSRVRIMDWLTPSVALLAVSVTAVRYAHLSQSRNFTDRFSG
jgi:hypothetical protein